MKDVFNMIALAVICLPLLLIFNEGDSILPNIIGLAYALILLFVGNIEPVKEYFDNTLKSLNNLIDKILK